MKILPTVNIQNGRAVPIVGEGEGAELLPLVAFLLDQGCHRLALVDVDAARGHGNNRDAIAKAIAKFHAGRPKVCIQVGGGIRSSDQAQFFLDQGATWLAVGTILQRSPVMVEQLLARFREHLTAAVDARGGEILPSGWGGASGERPEAAGRRIGDFGFKRLLFLDLPVVQPVQPDFATARTLAQGSRLAIWMGGSIQSSAHLAQAREVAGIQGVAIDGLLLRGDAALTASLALPGC
ncbi:HisA/HisF-related TIM barrel protein [Mesoterricola silvestris]|uniref:1-(5-phosphoribosyl)-5-[(5-phosphoribosylamino) methylideneamino] imidazole-4-carboxamide isomerase n=1 Tax=Mesoterricola silvestris TaxID=2927979 RepID=A0AA48H002_9BACT|nr:HisA/HisF-related TIM barrel protein [Mesoterricola silvestris]BDU74971.1 1-(5-phosphoribosyl)-5-[(5-phosphoribosylamino) methylideneamino] imidazole-4-carboxamide isomerase [Mesoterricola silvestris]